MYLDLVSLTNEFTSFDFSVGNTNNFQGAAYNTSDPAKIKRNFIVTDTGDKLSKEQAIAITLGSIAGIIQVVFGCFIFVTFMKNRRTYTKAAKKSKKVAQDNE